MTKHHAKNERIKRRYFAYLKEAKRHSEPTVDAVAKALDQFELQCTEYYAPLIYTLAATAYQHKLERPAPVFTKNP